MICRACSAAPPGTRAPVPGSTPSCPVTKRKSPARTAWLYAAVGGGGGASGFVRNSMSMWRSLLWVTLPWAVSRPGPAVSSVALQELPGAVRGGPLQERLRPRDPHHPALVEEHDPAPRLSRELHLMRHHDHPQSLAARM